MSNGKNCKVKYLDKIFKVTNCKCTPTLLNEVTKLLYFFFQGYLLSMSSFMDERLWNRIQYRGRRDIK